MSYWLVINKTKQAMVFKFRDLLQAVEFVSMQHDDDLWEELIKQCLNRPEMVKSEVYESKSPHKSAFNRKLVSL